MPGTAREIDASSMDLSQGEVYRKERRGEDPPVIVLQSQREALDSLL